MKINLTAVIIASLAGLLFGFDTAVISGVTSALRAVYHLSDANLGVAVSAGLWGTFIGALFMGRLGDMIGGRDALRIIALMYVLATLGSAVSTGLWPFVACRFVLGMAIGGSSVLAPVYISEIVPAERRGQLVGLFQFNIVFGILLAYLSNYAVGQLIHDGNAWRWKLGLAAIPAGVFFLLLFGISQSARWLVAKGRTEAAADSLRRLGISDPAPLIADFARSDVGQGRLSLSQHGKPILFAVLLALFNQLTGINAILYYLNDIFSAAGFSSVSADQQSIAVGAANLLATLVGMSLIDRFGRKRLLTTGAIGCALALAGVAVVMWSGEGRQYLLALLILFIVSFAFSQGAVIWVYISEIFPTPVRATGQSVGSATHWLANAVISLVFPIVAAETKALPFVFFAACTAIQFVVVARFFPETKGVELEDIAKEF